MNQTEKEKHLHPSHVFLGLYKYTKMRVQTPLAGFEGGGRGIRKKKNKWTGDPWATVHFPSLYGRGSN